MGEGIRDSRGREGVLCFTTPLNDIEEFLSVMTYFQLSAKSFVVRLSFPVGCCHIPQVIRSIYGYNIFSFFSLECYM